MTDKTDAQVLESMAAEWRHHDDLSAEMQELALRVRAARQQEDQK